jgi:hypothetical protein
MIVRPLDLASQLRPEPRDFDTLFYVNVGLLVLFFTLFGSRFVLAPGLGLNFQVPQVSVLRTGQIFTDDGLFSMAQLQDWLQAQAKQYRRPSLLIRASSGAPVSSLTEISNLAFKAGFVRVVLGAEEPPAREAGGP